MATYDSPNQSELRDNAGVPHVSRGVYTWSPSHDQCGMGRIDLVYCRFVLLHLPDPASCLREMRAVLKPGGIIVVEDGDLASATSVPSGPMDAFAMLFGR